MSNNPPDAFPSPTPSLSMKKEPNAVDVTLNEGVGTGGVKRKNNRNHYGPKKKKLNLHNCAIRNLPVSAKTPVRILMELGQQQKFDIEYKFADPVKIYPDGYTEEDYKKEKEAREAAREANGKAHVETVVKKDTEDEEMEEDGEGKEFSLPRPTVIFSCTATVSGESYTGSGNNKQLAKNKAAEEAIKAMVMKVKDSGPDAAPWSALACLGLYKVFTEWESQGVALEHLFTNAMKPVHRPEEEKPNAIPTIITTLGPPEPQITSRDRKQRSEKKKNDGPKVAGKMPADPTSRHPVQLLNELHPGLDFKFFVGGENNYDCRVLVEEMDFCAKGRKNKKEAKKHAALEALRVLYNINYLPGSQFG